MACKGFDEQLVRHDSRVRQAMEQFVRVRLVKCNGLDLSLFQFDRDLTFAAFFLNADKTIYGRFGTRSDRKASKDISIEGFGKALEAALELHKNYPANKASLQGKTGAIAEFASPDEIPFLKGKFKPSLNYEGNTARSCLHCHQLGEATRRNYREARKPIPDKSLFPWPMPDATGLILDPMEKATVKSVTADSAAQRAGFKVRDEILSLNGQPMISIADVQWVLHEVDAPTTIQAQVRRSGRTQQLSLALHKGWRRVSDISWRATSWDLRRMGTGGMLLVELPSRERQRLGLEKHALALRVKHLGQYGEHATAKKAGFRKGDIIVNWDGHSRRRRETELLVDAVQNKQPADQVTVTVLRGDRRVTIQLPMR